MAQRRIFILSFFVTALFTATTFANPPYNTLSVQATFPAHENAYLNQQFDKGLQKAEALVAGKPNMFFTKLKPTQYHVSISIIESTKSNGLLNQKELTAFEKVTRKSIKKIGKGGYKGNIFGLIAFVHGVDSKGKEHHVHYSNPDDLDKILTGKDKIFGKKGSIITHVHYVARLGTARKSDPKGTPGLLKQDATKLSQQIAKDKKKHGFRDVYEKRGGEFTSHITLAVLKNHVGKNPSTTNPLDKKLVVKTYEKIFDSFKKWKTYQQKNKTVMFHLDHFSLQGEKLLPKRQFVYIKDLK